MASHLQSKILLTFFTTCFVTGNILKSGDPCNYVCEDSGGCTVSYEGPPRPGKIRGSCFPESFGGSCSGTPSECKDCNTVIQCGQEGQIANSDKISHFEKPNPPPLNIAEDEPCNYVCEKSGGCKVSYEGPPRSGKNQGSCFPESFGGSCSGTPPECRECNIVVRCGESGHLAPPSGQSGQLVPPSGQSGQLAPPSGQSGHLDSLTTSAPLPLPTTTTSGWNVVYNGNWCCGNSIIKWEQPEAGNLLRSNMEENEKNFIAPVSGKYQINIFGARAATSGNYGRIFLVSKGLKTIERKDEKQTYELSLEKGDSAAVWIADHSTSGKATSLKMSIKWGNPGWVPSILTEEKTTAALTTTMKPTTTTAINENGVNSQLTEVFDYNDLIDASHLPTFADSKDNCPLGYCGENAECTDQNTCKCKEGYSGTAYFWGRCLPAPCANDPCGSFSICQPIDDVNFKCSCPEGLNYLPDPEDPMSCILNPCSPEESSSRQCKPNFDEETCECERDPSIVPPPDVAPNDGFYGEWGEWSECPLTCRLHENDLPMRRTRRRVCNLPKTDQGLPCLALGPPIQEQMCGEMLCPRPPSWSSWGPWESCSSACPEDGEGTQQRRRICLETGNMEDTCATHPPPGPVIQTTKCRAPEGVSCTGANLAEWTEWSSCDLTCSDSEERGIQIRSRKCSGSTSLPDNTSGPGVESEKSCFGLHVSALKQFRGCLELPSCPMSPCHDGWWKAKEEGKFYYGCADTEDNGDHWCPAPGSVNNDGLVKINGQVHNCTKEELEDARETNRVRRSADDDNRGETFQKAIEECANKEDGDFCSALNQVFAEDSKRRIDRTEEIGFVKELIKLVGWDPLTRNDKDYRSPFVKFTFYQDVLHVLPEVINYCTNERPYIKPAKVDKQCPKIDKGKKKFEQKIDNSVDEIEVMAKSLHKTARDFAKAKITNAAIATAAGAAVTTVAIVGATCAPVTFGASLVLTAVGTAATVGGVATAVSSLVTTLAENGVTDKKLNALKREHEAAARCVQRIVSMNIALDESSTQASRFLATKDWNKTMTKLADLKTVQLNEDIEHIVEKYIDAYNTVNKTLGNENFKENLKQISRDDEPEEDGTEKSQSEISKEVLNQIIDCGSESDPARCIVNGNPIAILIRSLQVANDPDEDREKAWYSINRAFETYKAVGKGGIRGLKSNEVLEKFVDKFGSTNMIPLEDGKVFENLFSDTKLTGQTKRYKSLAKIRDTFTTIAGGPVFNVKGKKIKLFDWVSEKKNKLKKLALDAVKNTFDNNIKNGKFGQSKAGQFLKKGFTKISAKVGKLVATKTFIVVSKLGLGLFDVGLGIWELVESVDQLKEGSKDATAFEEASKKLAETTETHSKFISNQYDTCKETFLDKTCDWSKWSSWGECTPYHSFDCGASTPESKNDWVKVRRRKKNVNDGSIEEAPQCTGPTYQMRACTSSETINGPGWIHVTDYSCPSYKNGFFKKTHIIGEGGKAVYDQLGRPVRGAGKGITYEDGKWVIKFNKNNTVLATCSGSKCPLGRQWKAGRSELKAECLTWGCDKFAPVDCILTDWTSWTPCSKRCDEGTRTRSRRIKQKVAFGGRPCKKNRKETEDCKLRQCKGAEKVYEGNWGTWGKWSLCPEGSYVFGFRLRTEEDQGWWTDDTAANAIELACRKPRSSRTTRFLRTKEKTWGDWSAWSYCSGRSNPIAGFQVKDIEPGSDDTSINNVKMVCNDGDLATVSAHTDWGTWRTKRMCQRGYAVVGIKTRVDEGGFGAYDDTALNGLRVKCEYFLN